MKDVLKIISSVLVGIIVIYLFVVFLLWIFTDPFNLVADIEKCKYQTESISCVTKEKYCRYETKKMFDDLNDTWGSNTNNQDAMSKTMLEVYNKCLEKE